MALNPTPYVNPAGSAAEPKFVLRSKTILGALILALPQLLGAFGVAFSDADAQRWLEISTTVLGLLGILVGRVTASGPVHFGGEKLLAFLDRGWLAIIGCIVVTTLLGGCATAKVRGGLSFSDGGRQVDVTTDGKSVRVDGGVNLDGNKVGGSIELPLPRKNTGGLAK